MWGGGGNSSFTEHACVSDLAIFSYSRKLFGGHALGWSGQILRRLRIQCPIVWLISSCSNSSVGNLYPHEPLVADMFLHTIADGPPFRGGQTVGTQQESATKGYTIAAAAQQRSMHPACTQICSMQSLQSIREGLHARNHKQEENRGLARIILRGRMNALPCRWRWFCRKQHHKWQSCKPNIGGYYDMHVGSQLATLTSICIRIFHNQASLGNCPRC